MGKFDNVYMRPNLSSTGTVPAAGDYAFSPDIWPAGEEPIVDWQTSLVTADSYTKESQKNTVKGKDNYYYIRCKNDTNRTISSNVTLYYSPASTILWPSMWMDNVIPTDMNNKKAHIDKLPPGQIGTIDRPFLWKRVPNPSSGDHYCLIAQINDDQNTNPFLPIDTQLDQAALMRSNLRWAQRNITVVDKGAPTFSYNANISVPINVTPGSKKYKVTVAPDGYIGWEVEFVCSMPGSDGKAILLEKTKITADNMILGCSCKMEPGYSAQITVYMYNKTGSPAKAGATVPLEVAYETNQSEVKEALNRNLIDHTYSKKLHLALHNVSNETSVGIVYYLRLGSYNSIAK